MKFNMTKLQTQMETRAIGLCPSPTPHPPAPPTPAAPSGPTALPEPASQGAVPTLEREAADGVFGRDWLP